MLRPTRREEQALHPPAPASTLTLSGIYSCRHVVLSTSAIFGDACQIGWHYSAVIRVPIAAPHNFGKILGKFLKLAGNFLALTAHNKGSALWM